MTSHLPDASGRVGVKGASEPILATNALFIAALPIRTKGAGLQAASGGDP